MKWYVMEVKNNNSLRRATAFEAKNLTSAKRTASRKQVFFNTILYLGNIVDEDGFVIDAVAIKQKNGRWFNVE